MSEQEPSDYSEPFREHLRELGVEPILIGALAATRYRAEGRATTDVEWEVSERWAVAQRRDAERS